MLRQIKTASESLERQKYANNPLSVGSAHRYQSVYQGFFRAVVRTSPRLG